MALQFFDKPIFSNPKLVFSVLFLAILFTAIQRTFVLDSNNYKIFYYSLTHLREGVNMYGLYPHQYLDQYLYAPAFAVLFSPFFLLPFKVGLFLWHLFFGAVWVLAVYKMPITRQQKAFACWYGLMELMTALGNSQTNPLIAAVPLFAMIFFEKNKPFWAAFFIILGFNIKIYSLVAASLFLVYPKKIQFILSCIFWTVVMGALPLLFTSYSKFIFQYQEWLNRLFVKTDTDKWKNISIHRIIHQNISADINTMAIVLSGAVLFCTVFIHRHVFHLRSFRFLLLASGLIYQVIFHPAAESASYLTAVTGVIFWWFVCPKTWLDKTLLIACFIFTVLSPTEFMPSYLKKNLIFPYVLKAWPCVLIWFRILYLMHAEGFQAYKQRSTDLQYGR
jgi:hypothetical protein